MRRGIKADSRPDQIANFFNSSRTGHKFLKNSWYLAPGEGPSLQHSRVLRLAIAKRWDTRFPTIIG
jgi:hypothetical protein